MCWKKGRDEDNREWLTARSERQKEERERGREIEKKEKCKN